PPRKPPTPAQAIRLVFHDVNRRVLDMARDFPAEKYSYAPAKDVRSFGDVVVHIASGNAFGAKIGRGEKANWDEIDPKTAQGKAAIVALLERTINEAEDSLRKIPDDRFHETLSPWLAIIEHDGEHYGQLVVYYRANGMVPPESRPKSK
ncbi:MAG TPA: DinB family protein, partial [Bryobacteraceae bacterium]